jgi:hypothetical protein
MQFEAVNFQKPIKKASEIAKSMVSDAKDVNSVDLCMFYFVNP